MREDKRETILLVDDEESITDVASEFFSLKGYSVRTASNGLEATRILQAEKVDCCFTDINMPEMDGLELAEHIRKTDNSVPVVIMTGYPSLDNTIRTLKNGVVDFLIKPVNLNQMELCVQRVLRERRLFAENMLLKNEVECKARIERINQELLSKVEELHILNRIMTDFTAIGTSTDVLRRMIEMAVEITHADSARFHVINKTMAAPIEVAAFSADQDNPDLDRSAIIAAARSTLGEAVGSPGHRSAQDKLILEIVADQIPLLISESKRTRGLPESVRSFMAVPLKIRQKVFGVITATVMTGSARFSEKDLYYLSFMAQNAAHAIENLALYENIYENLFATLFAFVKAVEARDSYTQQHSNRVTEYALELGRQMGCNSEDLETLNFAGRLHDIGKIGIPDDILLKPGRLTDAEFERIKNHPSIGADIVGQLGLWDREALIIRCHHERFDGSGYPDGLQGDAIPLLARILSVCDAFDAMNSDRVYRHKMAMAQILGILNQGAGSQFDPQIVATFLRLKGIGAA
jgi:putative nucleotidyltransferase with HDIG domain